VSGSGNLDMDNRDVTQNLRVQESDRVSVQIDSGK